MEKFTYKDTNFCEGYKRVQVDKHWNFVDENSNILSPSIWFNKGFARIFLNGKMNYVDKNGKMLYKEWFSSGSDFNSNGIAFVWKDEKCNAINIKGEFLLDCWYESIDSYKDKEHLQVFVDKTWKLVKIR